MVLHGSPVKLWKAMRNISLYARRGQWVILVRVKVQTGHGFNADEQVRLHSSSVHVATYSSLRRMACQIDSRRLARQVSQVRPSSRSTSHHSGMSVPGCVGKS